MQSKPVSSFMFSRIKGSKTYITTVLILMWLVTGVCAYFMCTYHVSGELSTKVVAASAPIWANHLDSHLFEFIWSGPQVVNRSPASCFDLVTGVGVRASSTQKFHRFNRFGNVKWTIQLQKPPQIMIPTVSLFWFTIIDSCF